MQKPTFRLRAATGLLLLPIVFGCPCIFAQKPRPEFKALVLTERGGLHEPFVAAALPWLERLAVEKHFTLKVLNKADQIDEALLADCGVFIQLNFPPYTWSDRAMAAFRKYIEEGKSGGWVGFHHATLLGEFDGYPMWGWFSGFMGGIRFKDYIAGMASGRVNVEDDTHPCMRGLPSNFVIENDEWYTYDRSPRPRVRVLASVDESSYRPASEIRMGDHPVVWTNEAMKARNLYIFMGHDKALFQNQAYTTLVRNAILWAAGR
jgi:hypothetical protein